MMLNFLIKGGALNPEKGGIDDALVLWISLLPIWEKTEQGSTGKKLCSKTPVRQRLGNELVNQGVG